MAILRTDRFDFVADLENFGGLGDAFCPGEFRDVDETFNAFFEFDKRAVVDEVYNLAAYVCADRILAFDIFPRVGSGLFEAEGHAFAFRVDFDNHNGNLFADLYHFARVRDSAPAHVGDMEEAVETVEVDERAVIGDILYDASANVAGLDFGEKLAAFFPCAVLR